MIHVFATVNVRPGYKDKVLSELMRIQPRVLNESGCYQYLPLEDEKSQFPRQLEYRENTITLLEQWESVEHLEAHLATPHMKAYQERVSLWVESVSLQILRVRI